MTGEMGRARVLKKVLNVTSKAKETELTADR